MHLVLGLAPRGPGHPGGVAAERHQPPRAQGEQDAVALRPAPVEVHRQLRPRDAGGERLERPGVEHGVDRPAPPRQRRERRRAGQDQAVRRERGAQGPERREPGEEIPQAQRPQREEERPVYGQEPSVDGVTTSSRTSQPTGWESAKRTTRATSPGSLRRASAGGR
jgi:hypothetical protein